METGNQPRRWNQIDLRLVSNAAEGGEESVKRALITGVTGQDGSYLSELLLEKGYEVHGVIRRSSTFNTSRIDHLYKDPHETGNRFHLHYGDITDGVGISNLVREIEPHEIYNLAAQSHVKVSFEMPDFTAQVDAVGTIRLLEAIRAAKIDTKFYQASTSELFGSTPPPQSETSPFAPQSPYAAAKLYSYWVVRNYRDAYGLHATNGILFNHESPRRGETFVTRKITMAAAKIKLGLQTKLYLGNLDAVRDWGYAPEYVESMWLMLQEMNPNDYVVATGTGATVRDFCEASFSALDLDYREYVETEDRYTRPTEVDALIGDPSKAERILGWKALTHWKELAELMVESDLVKLQKDNS
jgi:GDPmannose 4,6-dehydratase